MVSSNVMIQAFYLCKSTETRRNRALVRASMGLCVPGSTRTAAKRLITAWLEAFVRFSSVDPDRLRQLHWDFIVMMRSGNGSMAHVRQRVARYIFNIFTY